jgi:C4-dicarboxylate-specific signal transduction histidine kinase
MRHARRLIAIIIGGTAWTVFATASAYAAMLPDPPPAGSSALSDTSPPVWEYAATATLVVLLTLALVGLVTSLTHQRRHSSRNLQRSKPQVHA